MPTPSITAIRKEVGPSSDSRSYVAVTRPATLPSCQPGHRHRLADRAAQSPRLDKVVHKRSYVRIVERKIIGRNYKVVGLSSVSLSRRYLVLYRSQRFFFSFSLVMQRAILQQRSMMPITMMIMEISRNIVGLTFQLTYSDILTLCENYWSNTPIIL